MLNLLISILGDSFDKLRSESVEHDCIEMMEIIMELEILMFWKRDLNSKRYMQVCYDSGLENAQIDWEGRFKSVSSLIKKCHEEDKQNFKSVQEKLKEIETLKVHYLTLSRRLEVLDKVVFK